MIERAFSSAGPTENMLPKFCDLELSWQSALQRLGDQPDLYSHHARAFVAQLGEDRVEIGEHLLRGELQPAAKRLHTLRGVAATLGADSLALGAKEFEISIQERRNPSELADRLDRFERLLSQARQSLRSLSEQLDLEHAEKPLSMAESPLSDVGSDPTQAGGGTTTRPKILVVDDQEVNNLIFFHLLREEHEVLMATSGTQALEISRRVSPDLILLDILMPEMGGLETCRRLKADPKTQDIPVIFVTSQDSPNEETTGLQMGAVDFISRPFSTAVVKARVRAHLMLKAQSDMLKSMAFVDGLTGIPNRRRFDQQLDLEWRAACRNDAQLSILMIDIDHFKAYNDRYGHPEGDRCLRRLAEALQGSLRRPRDFVARYGGEEFVCLLPETELSGAATKARQLVRDVEDLRIPHEASMTANSVTLSIGVASVTPNKIGSAAELVATADTQLYRAKKAGRNRVAALQDEPCLGTLGERGVGGPVVTLSGRGAYSVYRL